MCSVLLSSHLRYVVIEELDYLRDVVVPQKVHTPLMPSTDGYHLGTRQFDIA